MGGSDEIMKGTPGYPAQVRLPRGVDPLMAQAMEGLLSGQAFEQAVAAPIGEQARAAAAERGLGASGGGGALAAGALARARAQNRLQSMGMAGQLGGLYQTGMQPPTPGLWEGLMGLATPFVGAGAQRLMFGPTPPATQRWGA